MYIQESSFTNVFYAFGYFFCESKGIKVIPDEMVNYLKQKVTNG
tara:strand:+ start:241 stop:372 length:132 start_codon:yes stop_codon:yes gene_type:complete